LKFISFGYNRISIFINSILFLNLAYTDLFPKLSLGTNLFFILSEYAKTQNKKYLYIYESYDNLFNYKQNFENVEIWNGREWLINYGKS
jgi:arginyl-tRNA--protein-N-Asp/Glu arginylyltransferase